MISHKQALMQKKAAPTNYMEEINGIPMVILGNGGTKPFSADEEYKLEEDPSTMTVPDPWNEMYKNKKGKTPKATSEDLGQLTSWGLAAGLAGGAGGLAGAYIGHELGNQRAGTGLGIAAGMGLATLAAALIGYKIGVKGPRSPEEQAAYKESGTLADYLVPGVADGNRRRSVETYLMAYNSNPKLYHLVGKDPGYTSESLDADLASDDQKRNDKAWKFMLDTGLAADAEEAKRESRLWKLFRKHYGLM